MSFWAGVGYSLAGAFAHSAIDTLRKFASQRLPPADLIALLTLYNVAFAVLGVVFVDGGLPALPDIPDVHLLAVTATVTALLGVVASLLYQRAVSIAPLSLTVPYLAFAPVFVVFVSPLFLVGEVPSPMGLLGVLVVSIAGYLLGVLGAPDAAPHGGGGGGGGCGAAGKSPLPLLSPQHSAGAGGAKGGGLKPGQLAGSPLAATPLAYGSPQQQPPQQQQKQPQPPQQHAGEQQQTLRGASEHAHAPGLQPRVSSSGGTEDGWREQEHRLRAVQPGAARLQTQRSPTSSSGGKPKSPWAVAYYKIKAPAHGGAAAAAALGSSLGAAAAHLLGSTPSKPSKPSPRTSTGGGGGAADDTLPVANGGAAGGLQANGLRSPDGGDGGGGGWVDSQAKSAKPKEARQLERGALLGGARLGAAARRLWLAASRRGPLRRLARAGAAAGRLLSGPRAGPAMVLCVALLYSLTASLDKLGMGSAPSVAFYILCQRSLIAVGGLAYLCCVSPGAARHFAADGVLLFSLSLVEQLAVVLYFKAVQNILVSYMVAIKRVNVLLSTLVGCVCFNERVGRRIPYILLMLCGMLLIVLQPGHEVLHHSHHTRH